MSLFKLFVREQMKYQYVEVVYLGEEGTVFGVQCSPKITVQQLLDDCGVSYQGLEIGIHQRLVSLSDTVKDGDRVELYSPLQVDPKQKRRRLVEHRKRYKKHMGRDGEGGP